MRVITALSITLLFLLFQTPIYADKGDFEKVSLQLFWKHQFEFAGYYIAKEKGFYKEQNLNVVIKEFDFNIDVVNDVKKNISTFGIGNPSLILDQSKNNNFVMLDAILQSSPAVLVSLKSSNIKDFKDFKNKSIMISNDAAGTASLVSMLKSNNISLEKDMKKQAHSFNINDLIDGNTDIMTVFSSNELYELDKLGIEYNTFDPKDHSFDFYDVILFTKQNTLTKNREMVENFKKASLKGWIYAFDNIEETTDLILKKYNTQNKTKDALIYEAKVLKKLAYKDSANLGDIDKNKIQRIFDIYNLMGLTKNKIDIDKFVYKPIDKIDTFTNDEKVYLKNNKLIKMCNNHDVEPLEFAYNDNQNDMRGISIDTLKIIEQQVGIKFINVPTKNWKESLKFLKEKKCDILPAAAKNNKRTKYANFTKHYLEFPLAILTHKDKGFISTLDSIIEQRFSRRENSGMINILKEKYPLLKVIKTKSSLESLKSISNGSADFTIDIIPVVSTLMSQYIMEDIHIAGYTNMVYKLSIAVRDDDVLLLNILNKSLNHISKKQHADIYKKWVTPIVKENVIDYTLLLQVLFIVFLLILAMVSKHFTLKKLNLKLKKEVEKKTKDLQDINKNLEELVDKKTKKLFQSEETFRILFDTAPIFIDSFDKDGKCVLWNKECQKVFGWSIDDINNSSNPLELFYPDPIIQKKAIDTIINEPEKVFRQWKPLNNKGEILTTMWAHIYLPNGEIINIGYDITEIKQKEKLFIQQSKLASMGEMIGNIAHQWRQPLSVISTASSGLQLQKEHDILTDKIFDNTCNTINKNAQYLSKTIDNFSNYVKGDLEIVEFNLNEKNNNFLELVDTNIKKYDIDVILNTDNDLNIKGYPNQLIECFIIIFDNAKDALVQNNEQKNRYIFIDQKIIENNIIITFKDNGDGIKDEIIHKIFEPYFTTKHQAQGTGLGLNICYNSIVNNMHGSLDVENIEYLYNDEKQRGTKFTITIPTKLEA